MGATYGTDLRSTVNHLWCLLTAQRVGINPTYATCKTKSQQAALRNPSGDASGNLPEPSGMQEIKQSKQASGQASGNLPEPSGTRAKYKKSKQASGHASGNLPETFRDLPELG